MQLKKCKFCLVVLLTVICLLLMYYFHFFAKSQLLFTHAFYIPIVIASMFYKRVGILLSLFLGLCLILSQYYSGLGFTMGDFVRPLVFTLVAFTVTALSCRNRNYSVKLKQTQEYEELYNKLKITNNELNIAYKKLAENEKNLARSNADKDAFMRILAHDLRSPFNSLIGLSDSLLDNLEAMEMSEIKTHVSFISQMVNRTFVLLDDLLLWSRAKAGQLVFEPVNLNFNSLVADIIDEKNNQASLKSIKLINNVLPNTYLFADAHMLKTVVRNLVSNAIKFTKSNGIVEISAVKYNNECTVKIIDNGVGIDADSLVMLWDFGKTITTRGTNNEKGTGLGLVLCKEFVKKHNGKIWAESQPGIGSSFIFTIPQN